MFLTLSEVAANPTVITSRVLLPSGKALVLRPLESGDVDKLTTFLEGLSPRTRRVCTYPGYDVATAQEFCDAINRYDKLRIVVEEAISERVVGLMEFSLDVTGGDVERFVDYNIQLELGVDCRFGPCLSDDYQNQGIGSVIFPYMLDVAKKFGQKRVILWGGVLSENQRAIRYYEKNGFRRLGEFKNSDYQDCVDMILGLDVHSPLNNG